MSMQALSFSLYDGLNLHNHSRKKIEKGNLKKRDSNVILGWDYSWPSGTIKIIAALL